MFEKGNPTKLNSEFVEKIAKKFGIDIESAKKDFPAEAVKRILPSSPIAAAMTGFCPNEACPTNSRYEVDGRYFYLPDRAKADPAGARYCAYCGEVLVRTCPNCGAPVHAGAICSFCGESYL